MGLLARAGFAWVRWKSRRGLRGDAAAFPDERKQEDRRVGVRGETYAYWYLRRHGYIIVARNYKVPGMKGEIDLVGFDGEILAFIEVKTRSRDDEAAGLPEDAVNKAKRRVVSRMARAFLRSTRTAGSIYRFYILAIESRRGRPPVVRLHKDAFAEQP